MGVASERASARLAAATRRPASRRCVDPRGGLELAAARRERGERRPGVGDDADADRHTIAADLARLDVDLDEVSQVREAAVAEEVVELLADDEQDVGLEHDVLPVATEAVRMIVGQGAARRPGG